MRRPPFLATFLTLTGVAILCSLGIWQINRLGWKQNLLQEIAQVSATEPQTLNAADIADALAGNRKFLRGMVRGEYLAEASFPIRPRVLDGKQGAHLITPLRLDDSTTLLVNRGWIPADAVHDFSAPKGIVAIEGWLRFPDRANSFTPPNIPSSGQWYSIDTEALSKTFGLQGLLPLVLYAEKDSKDNVAFPVAVSGKPDLNNNHLSYALFWFAMGGALIAVFIFRFIAPKK